MACMAAAMASGLNFGGRNSGNKLYNSSSSRFAELPVELESSRPRGGWGRSPPEAGVGLPGRTNCLSLSTEKLGRLLFILEQGRSLATGKLDLVFDLSGDAVASRGTESPKFHGIENAAISDRTRALQNQGAVNMPVDTDNKANFNPAAVTDWHD